ncbi:carboxypeptidase-like regulatory domain-containing protein [Hymenobacter sp. HD11105]
MTETDSASVPAGPTILTGTILGVRDQPLAGATVSIATEPNKAGITNSAGGYMLRTMAESPVLRVSYAGYTALELPITNSKPLVIRLEPIEKYEKDRKKRAKTAVKEYRKP